MTINISGSAGGQKAKISVTRKGATAPDERTEDSTFSETLCEGDTLTIIHEGPAEVEQAPAADEGEGQTDPREA